MTKQGFERHVDGIYNGHIINYVLFDGVGYLADGRDCIEDIEEDEDDCGWVGWEKEGEEPVEIVFKFDGPRIFEEAKFTTKKRGCLTAEFM